MEHQGQLHGEDRTAADSRPESPAVDVTTPLHTPPPPHSPEPVYKSNGQNSPQEQHDLRSYQEYEQPGLIPVTDETPIPPGKGDDGKEVYNNEQKEVLLGQPDYGAAYEPAQNAKSENSKILGLRRKTFWIVFGIVIAVIVIGAAVGGGVGGALSSKHSSPNTNPTSAAAASAAASTSAIITTPKLPDNTVTVTQIAPGAKTLTPGTSTSTKSTTTTSEAASKTPDSGCPKSDGSRTIPIDPYTNESVVVNNTVQRYRTVCKTDWPAGAAFGNPRVKDVWVDNLVTGQGLSNTMANCMLLCAWYNSNFNSTNMEFGDTSKGKDGTGGDRGFMPGVLNACRAVVLEIKAEGRCWLKNTTGNATQYSTYEVDAAVLVP